MMYIPPHFRQTDPQAITALIAAAPLAAVVAQTGAGLVANHIPLFQEPSGDLIGHVALSNDMHRLIGPEDEVVAIFRGPQGYVSPGSYPSKAEHHRHVPTWNYEVVHVHGRIAFRQDEASKRIAVARLTALQEGALRGAAAWRMAEAPADYLQSMLAAIVAFRITPSRILAKAKLSQNREPRDLQGAVADLRARGEVDLARRMAEPGKPD